MLQSLFTWIFYLFNWNEEQIQEDLKLQSLFTWIFYLFLTTLLDTEIPMNASILIHLDFLSISLVFKLLGRPEEGFNPYSPGFSIYLLRAQYYAKPSIELQSLFTWIFYLFKL